MSSEQKSVVMWAIFIAIVVGISAIAIPKYVMLSKELRMIQARNLASGLTSATAVNYTQKKYNSSMGVAIKSCKDAAYFTGNNLPAGYHITDQEVQSEIITSCMISAPGIEAIPFSEIGIR